LNEILGERTSVHPPAGIEIGTDHSVHLHEMEDIFYVDGDYQDGVEEVAIIEVDKDEVVPVEDPGTSISNSKRKYPASFEAEIIATTPSAGIEKRVTKQSRLLQAFEAKSKAKEKEVVYQLDKLDFRKEKWIDERCWRDRKLTLEEDRERHRMAMETKSTDLEELRLTQQHELDKLKLEKEHELQLKLAKIKHGLDVE
jgi:hypothetical protein